MKRRIFRLCLALLLCGGMHAVRAASPAEAVNNTMRAYEAAWSRHDPAAIAAFYYEPALRVSPTGPEIRSTHADELEFFSTFLPALVKAGYDHSRWDRMSVHLLDARTAFASGVVTRYRRGGGVFQRQGVTYGLWRTGAGWKIYLSATHAPGAAMKFR